MTTDINEIDPNDARLTFVRPALEFKGKKLQHYSLGMKILWFNVVDLTNDSYQWIAFSLLFLLTLPRPQAQKLAFDKDAFRTACLNWIDSLSEEDIDPAATLFKELTDKTEASRIDVLDEGEKDEKKD